MSMLSISANGVFSISLWSETSLTHCLDGDLPVYYKDSKSDISFFLCMVGKYEDTKSG